LTAGFLDTNGSLLDYFKKTYPPEKRFKSGVRTRFVRTRFVRARFVRTRFVRTKFVRTRFVRTRLVRARFVRTKFFRTKCRPQVGPRSITRATFSSEILQKEKHVF
jgi:hypothetical protein